MNMDYPLNKVLLKLRLVDVQILLPFPYVIIILFNNICCNKSHLDKCLNAAL